MSGHTDERGGVSGRLKVILLDAGNTVVFLDHDAVADIARTSGIQTDGATLRAAEGAAKRTYERLLTQGGSHEDGWGTFFIALFQELGISNERARQLVPVLRRAHDEFNLWRVIPSDFVPAIERALRNGLRVAIVSNSEGQLDALFVRLGVDHLFEIVVDSHHEGVRKPDPEIFRRALSRLQLTPSDAVYLGDIPGVDIVGARAASIRGVLVDPWDFYPEFDGERVGSAAQWVDRYLSSLTPALT